MNVSVAKHLHHVEAVFSLVVFHGGFPMPEGMEVYLSDSFVLEFVSDVGSLASEVSGKVSTAAGEGVIFFLWSSFFFGHLFYLVGC